MFDPLLSHRGGYEIALVQHKDQMLIGTVFLQVILHSFVPHAQGIPAIKDVDHDVGRVNDFVEFIPDTAGEALVKDGVSNCIVELNKVVLVDIVVLLLVIPVKPIICVLE